jgi:hypothetical protein
VNRRWIAGLIGLGVVIAATSLALARRNTITAIDRSEAQAVATATSVATAASTATTATEQAGELVVYEYGTTGYEEIDALGGAEHTYPEQTFLTIRPGGCGQIYRWQAIEERWTSWEVCDPGRMTIGKVDSFHSWFGSDDLQQYRCPVSTAYLPPPGITEWTFTCSAEDRAEETTATVIGDETIDIGGVGIETQHIRFATVLSGESTGTRVIDRWFAIDEPLLVKEVSSTESDSTSLLGTVHYTEQYEMLLEDLSPVDE